MDPPLFKRHSLKIYTKHALTFTTITQIGLLTDKELNFIRCLNLECYKQHDVGSRRILFLYLTVLTQSFRCECSIRKVDYSIRIILFEFAKFNNDFNWLSEYT